MNKKDIATIKKQFKQENFHLHIHQILNVYVQKETRDIYHTESQHFSMLEEDTQQLFFTNFKKVLTGQLGSKLYELKFTREEGNSTQDVLYNALGEDNVDNFEENMIEMVEKMYRVKTYDFDTVVTFISGKFRAPIRQKENAFGEEKIDGDFLCDFILCSVNKTNPPKRELIFDYIEKSFKSPTNVDPIINMTSPIGGFLFPTFQDGITNVNHILYRANKTNELDTLFIEEVLQCESTLTSQEDKNSFELIVNHVTNHKINTETISAMYEEIEKIVEMQKEFNEDEPATIDQQDVERILKQSGIGEIDTEKVKKAFTTVVADEQHEFKADSLIPKKININTENAKIALTPDQLHNLKYVNYNGRKCLLIEIDDEVNIEGFLLENSH